ncbi:UNVERIFIED_CONTAM: hypothetical protein Cloal_0087 [Acetivibrio alkalicellulosi]
MKKIFGIVAIVILIGIITAGVVFSFGRNEKRIPEPPREGKDIPSDVVWDETEGMYKLKEEELFFNANAPSDFVESFVAWEEEDKWIAKHKDSTSKLDRAMIKWIENRKLDSAFKSRYEPDKDKTFKEIVKLGVEYLPEMLDRIEEDNAFKTGVLMDAFSRISNVDALKRIDVSEEGKKEWKQKCKDVMENAEQKVKNAKEKINNGDVESAKNEIKELGVFALPYVVDEIENGNKNMETLLDTKKYSQDELEILKNMVEKTKQQKNK